MKKIIFLLFFLVILIASCRSSQSRLPGQNQSFTNKNGNPKIGAKRARIANDTIRIANDSLEYEVIIIDPGFSVWLDSRAFPRGYHSQSYLENKNNFYINEWNNRVMQPQLYNPNLYEMTIDYNQNINYGYEVNYLIYNYMIYFQNTFNQKLFGFVPIR